MTPMTPRTTSYFACTGTSAGDTQSPPTRTPEQIRAYRGRCAMLAYHVRFWSQWIAERSATLITTNQPQQENDPQ